MDAVSPQVLKREELDKLEGFIGYGRKDAEVVFFGLEEAGGGWENLKTRLSITNYKYLDCKRFHLDEFKHSKPYELHSDEPNKSVNFQPVWKYMSYLMLKLENRTDEEIFKKKSKLQRDYQNNSLGTLNNNGKTLLTEIYPIPCPSLNRWEDYQKIIPFYAGKKEYKLSVLPKRIELFRDILESEEFQAKAIFCYGKSHWGDFKKFFKNFNVEFQCLKLSKPTKIGRLQNGTKVFLIPFLGNGQVSYTYLKELSKEIDRSEN